MGEPRIRPAELIEAERILRRNYQLDIAAQLRHRITAIFAIQSHAEKENSREPGTESRP